MILDYKDIDDLNRYKIMSGTVIPRPIAWIVTDDDGVLNAAPFSYFIPISSNPALLIVAIGRKDDGSPKDSLANILKTKKGFTESSANPFDFNGAPGRNRTHDQELRRFLLYPTELRAHRHGRRALPCGAQYRDSAPRRQALRRMGQTPHDATTKNIHKATVTRQ